MKRQEFFPYLKTCMNNIHNRHFPHPREVQLLVAQPKYKYFVQNHPEDTPAETINQRTVALGCFPKAKSLKNVNISLLPSFLRIIESGSHCPLLIFEERKNNGRNLQLPRSTAQLLGFQSTFHISNKHYMLHHRIITKWFITGKPSQVGISARGVFE